MRFLFFAPHSALWVHAFPEALVAEALRDRGHDIDYVHCGRLFRRHCVAMTASGVTVGASSEARDRVCRDCSSAALTLRRRFGFRGQALSDVIDDSDREAAEAIVAQVDRASLLATQLHGVEVGRLALYEFLLDRKRASLVFDEADWAEYLIALRHACLSLLAAKRIVDATKPDVIVTYNSLYSVNRAACDYARSRAARVVFLHAGLNLSRRLETLLIGEDHTVRFYEEMLAFWPRVRANPCMPALVERVADHLVELLRGRNVFAYSTASSADGTRVREVLRLDARPVVAATMSSPDERFAGEMIGAMRVEHRGAFRDQRDWIAALCAWAASRSDVQVVVRVHPREFPNKREGVTSEHGRALRETLAAIPPNVRVNWPEDAVSLYDLASVTDVFLNAWSSAGKEMAMLGLPVVVWAPDKLFYPSDLNIVARTPDDYFAAIDAALRSGWSAERLRSAWRWCALEYERCVFDLSASFPQSERHKRSLRHQFDRVLDRLSPRLRREADCLRRRPLAEADAIERVVAGGAATRLDFLDPEVDRVTPAEEDRALAIELRRLMVALFGDASAGRGGHLQRRLAALAA